MHCGRHLGCLTGGSASQHRDPHSPNPSRRSSCRTWQSRSATARCSGSPTICPRCSKGRVRRTANPPLLQAPCLNPTGSARAASASAPAMGSITPATESRDSKSQLRATRGQPGGRMHSASIRSRSVETSSVPCTSVAWLAARAASPEIFRPARSITLASGWRIWCFPTMPCTPSGTVRRKEYPDGRR